MLLLTACGWGKLAKEAYRYELYIDYRHVCFTGLDGGKPLLFEIDSTQGMRFWGHLFIDQGDTLLLQGFEKGSLYMTTYQEKETGHSGMLKIWSLNDLWVIPDSLSMQDFDEKNGILPNKVTLHRQTRVSCP
jgi:hypothetical protein